jgi:hypothetical protein
MDNVKMEKVEKKIAVKIVLTAMTFEAWRNVMIMCPYAPRGWPAV